MADIELIIKIPEEIYKARQHWVTNEKRVVDELDIAVAKGIPLPKGHGRIADMDEAIKCIEDVEGDDAIWAIALIEWACGKRTIIEADREDR